MALSSMEIFVIVAVIVLLFGAAAIPKLARSLGKAQGEFMKARKEFEGELQKGRETAALPGAPAPDASEEQIRKTARDLGIDEANLTLSEVKARIKAKLGE